MTALLADITKTTPPPLCQPKTATDKAVVDIRVFVRTYKDWTAADGCIVTCMA